MNIIFLNSLAVLLAYALCLNWQAAGNISSSNMSVIQSYINTNFSMGSETATTLTSKAGPFSDYLNSIWEPAWNVVITQHSESNTNFDTIVYGYAFRNHWMWINGLIFAYYKYPNSQSIFYGGLIIWKDYNCKNWLTINIDYASSNGGDFPKDPSTAVTAFFNSYNLQYDDIWNLAHQTVVNLETTATDFKGDHAYTMIISQPKKPYYFAQVCASNYYVRFNDAFGHDTPHGDWGSYLLLKMR